MTRLTTGLLIGLVLGLAAPAAAQRLGPIPDPSAEGRQWMREQQERHNRWNEQFQAQQQIHELQMLRLEIQRQGLEQQQRLQADRWRRFLNDD